MSKASDAPARPLLGRPSNHLQIGIVGLPNVGKSTLFNVLTKMSVPAEKVAVPDERYDWLVDHFKPKSEVAAQLQITDIAGLIRGAHKGEGLGNAFLSHIRAVDGIFQVVRIFEDSEVTHVMDSIDPVRDLEIIQEELILKDIAMVSAEVAKLEKVVQREKHRKPELEAYKKCEDLLKNQNKPVRFGDWKPAEVEYINELQCLTAKPVVYLVNMSEEDYVKKKNRWLSKIKQWVDEHTKEAPEVIIPICVSLEAKLVEMGPADGAEYLKKIGSTSIISKVIKTGYHAINLVHFFTCGTDEVRCWTIRKYTKAPAAAGSIHSDMQNGFICAEVMRLRRYNDYKELGSEAACRANGKHAQKGKEYVVEDGDILFFKFNTAGLKKK